MVYKVFLALKAPDHFFKEGELGLNNFEWVWKKYRKRFVNYLCKRVLHRNGKFPEMGKTDIIKELLRRGFIHKSEANINYKEKWYIEAHLADLVWPKDFKEQIDAIAIISKIGIPGQTGVKTLKKS